MNDNDINLIASDADVIRTALEAIPALQVVTVKMDNLHRPAITIWVSFDPRTKWTNGIYENSAHRVFILYNDGELKSIMGWHTRKFRACHVKNSAAAAAKLVKWATEH
jgi:hypothetical protein